MLNKYHKEKEHGKSSRLYIYFNIESYTFFYHEEKKNTAHPNEVHSIDGLGTIVGWIYSSPKAPDLKAWS